MNLTQAAHAGIVRIRLKQWIHPECYLRQDLYLDGSVGPFCHLFDRPKQTQIGSTTPQSVLRSYCENDAWEAYTGPVDRADTWDQEKGPRVVHASATPALRRGSGRPLPTDEDEANALVQAVLAGAVASMSHALLDHSTPPEAFCSGGGSFGGGGASASYDPPASSDPGPTSVDAPSGSSEP